MKYPHLLLIVALLSGCTALDAAKTVASIATEQPTLSVDAQLGDKTANVGETDNSMTEIEDNEGIVTVTSSKSDTSFGETGKVTINEGPNLMWGILMALGWLLPSPGTIWKEVKSLFRRE